MNKKTIFLFIVVLFILALFLTACGQVRFDIDFMIGDELYHTISTKTGKPIEMPENPTKEGYIFDGWYWDKGTWYEAFTANSLLDQPLSGDNLTVYARFISETDITGTEAQLEGFTDTGGILFLQVTNSITTFSFLEVVEVDSQTNWAISTDIEGLNTVKSKIVDLNEGENFFYLIVADTNGIFKTYSINILRSTSYSVVFNTDGGTSIPTQEVEKNTLAIEPSTPPTKEGYKFLGWDFDFIDPITTNIQINAIWEEEEITQSHYELTLIKNISIAGEVSGGGQKDNGAEVTISALSYLGYNWLGWYTGDTKISNEKDLSYTFNMTNSNKTIEAKWEVAEEMGSYIFNSTLEICNIESCSNKLLTFAFIPEYVTSIENQAFSDCLNLQSFSVDEDNNNFKSVDGILYNKEVNTLLIYPKGKQDISYSVSDSVTKINPFAFAFCTNIATLYIPSSVTEIGYSALTGCSGLTSITLPFVGNKPGVTIADDSTLFGYIFGNISYYGGTEIEQNYSAISYETYYVPSSLANVTITGGIILYGAFYNCTNLITVNITEGVNSISEHSFNGCYNLVSMTLPFVGNVANSVTPSTDTLFGFIFGATTFTASKATTQYYSNEAWVVYSIPTSLKNVTVTGGNLLFGAFYNCDSIENVVVSDNITSIESAAFRNCSSLTSLTLPFIGKSPDATGANALFGYIFGTSYITTPEHWITYQKYSFTWIGSSASYYISPSVRNVVITGGQVKAGAFYNCSKITSITLPDNLVSIGSHAFYNCSNITELTIPSEVENVGDYAFSKCTNLIDINIPEKVTSILANTFSECTSIANINLPGGITSIGASAFSGCTSLTSIIVPEGITSLGESAFSGCNSLTSFEIPSSLTNIKKSVFSGCEAINSFIIPDNVTSIGDYAFQDCISLLSIIVPQAVDTIGINPFLGCTSLSSIIVNEDNLKFKSVNGYLYDKEETILISYPLGKNEETLTISDSVITIGYAAVKYAKQITSLSLSNNLSNIETYAFSGCSGLKSIAIPESVESIGSYAFNGCSSLTSVIIPKSVVILGNYIFSGCDLTIYAKAISEPSGWATDWNSSSLPVVWNYSQT